MSARLDARTARLVGILRALCDQAEAEMTGGPPMNEANAQLLLGLQRFFVGFLGPATPSDDASPSQDQPTSRKGDSHA